MPDGSCNKLYETHSNALQGLQPRGNTPAVLVDRTFSGQTMSFYLGVFHIEKNKTYVNHFYKMQVRISYQQTVMCKSHVYHGCECMLLMNLVQHSR
jgi:hypothetical protein